MDYTNIKHLNAKFQQGTPLNDTELNQLLKFYDQLVQSLAVLGPKWSFAAREAREAFETLTSYQEARRAHKKS